MDQAFSAEYPVNENTTSHGVTFSDVERNSMNVDNNNNDMLVLNEKIDKLKLNVNTSEDDKIARFLNRDDLHLKWKKTSSVKRQARKAKHKLYSRMTVRKPRKVEDAELALRRYNLTSNVLCQMYLAKQKTKPNRR